MSDAPTRSRKDTPRPAAAPRPRSAARRLLWLLLPVGLWMIGSKMGLPGVDATQLPGNEGDSFPKLGLGMIRGSVAYIAAGYALVEIAAAFVPAWRPLRHRRRGRARLSFAALGVALLCAAIQGWRLVRAAGTFGGLASTLFIPWLTIVAVTAVLWLCVHLADSRGVGSSLALLLGLSGVLDVASREMWSIRGGAASPVFPAPWTTVLLSAVCAAATVAILRNPSRESGSPGESESPGKSGSAGEVGSPGQAVSMVVRVPPSGLVPFWMVDSLAALIVYLATELPGFSRLHSLPGVPVVVVLAVGLSWMFCSPAQVGAAWALLFEPSSEAAEKAPPGDGASSGEPSEEMVEAAYAPPQREPPEDNPALEMPTPRALPPARAAAWTKRAQALLLRATLPAAAYLALVAWPAWPVLERRELPGPLMASVASVCLLAAAIFDIVSEVRFRRAHRDAVAVLAPPGLPAADAALAALSESGIAAFGRNMKARALLSFFGPFAPIEILVPASLAEKARERLAPAIRLESGSDEEQDLRDAPAGPPDSAPPPPRPPRRRRKKKAKEGSGALRSAGAVLATLGLIAAASGTLACSSPGSGSGAAPSASPAATPKGPAAEAALFPAGKSVLADLPAMKLVPRSAPVVLAARDPAGAIAKLATLNGFSDAQDPLAKEIDAAAKEISKDLPELASLAQNGVDLGKPAGVVWMDPDLETAAIFASVSDEAAMKRWLEERAKQAKGKRELMTVDDALVLRAKRDVTRAVVLRKGHVFFVRARDSYLLDADRVIRAADALAKTPEAESVGADAAFTKAMQTLAFGSQATLYVGTARFAESLLEARGRALAAAQKQLEDAKAALADAEAKKRKGALDEAKTAVETAERTQRHAEQAAKKAEVLGLVKDEVPSVAAGIELGDREVKLKAFFALAKPGGVKLFAPIGAPSAVFDADLHARAAAQFAIDPRLLDFALDHLHQTSLTWRTLPLEPARGVLASLNVDRKELDPLLDGELSAASFPQKIAAPEAEDAGAGDDAGADAGAPAVRERDGFEVIWHVSDPARVTAILDAGWKTVEGTERAAKGLAKQIAPGSYEVARGSGMVARALVAGSWLVVTTLDSPSILVDPAKPHPPWMAASEQPFLKQLAAIEGASGIVAVGGALLGSRNASLLDSLKLDAMRSMALLGTFGSDKGKKLEEQRDKLQKQVDELEKALDRQKDAAWKTFAARLGSAVLYAKPADGGVAVYGGLATPEASLSALAEAGIAAWLSVGPKWERWGELSDLRKKIRDLDDAIDADRGSSIRSMLGEELGVPGPGFGGLTGRGSMFDDDVGSLLGAKPGLKSLEDGGDAPGGGAARTGKGGGALKPGTLPPRK